MAACERRMGRDWTETEDLRNERDLKDLFCDVFYRNIEGEDVI